MHPTLTLCLVTPGSSSLPSFSCCRLVFLRVTFPPFPYLYLPFFLTLVPSFTFPSLSSTSWPRSFIAFLRPVLFSLLFPHWPVPSSLLPCLYLPFVFPSFSSFISPLLPSVSVPSFTFPFFPISIFLSSFPPTHILHQVSFSLHPSTYSFSVKSFIFVFPLTLIFLMVFPSKHPFIFALLPFAPLFTLSPSLNSFLLAPLRDLSSPTATLHQDPSLYHPLLAYLSPSLTSFFSSLLISLFSHCIVSVSLSLCPPSH